MGDDNFPVDVVSRSSKSVEQISMNQPVVTITATLIAAIVRQTLAKFLSRLRIHYFNIPLRESGTMEQLTSHQTSGLRIPGGLPSCGSIRLIIVASLVSLSFFTLISFSFFTLFPTSFLAHTFFILGVGLEIPSSRALRPRPLRAKTLAGCNPGGLWQSLPLATQFEQGKFRLQNCRASLQLKVPSIAAVSCNSNVVIHN